MNCGDPTEVSRRRYLEVLGVGMTSLAGCQGGGGDDSPATTTTVVSTDTPTLSPTDGDGPGVGGDDESAALSGAEQSLAEFDYDGSWFDSHCHWGDASFFGDQDFDLADFTPVQSERDVGATVLLIRADVIASRYDHIVQALEQDDVDYLLFAGPGRQLQSVVSDRTEVLWGIGEIPFYEGTPQHGLSLTDSWIPTAIRMAAENDLVLQLHPTMDQEPQLAPTMDDHPGLTMLLHGHELFGTTELLDLLASYDDVYFTVDVGSVTGPLFFQSSGPSDFVDRLDSQESAVLNDIVPQVVAMLDTAPTQVMWGTDLASDWHIDPTAYNRIIEFSETLVQELPATHRTAFKDENAVAMFAD